MKVTDFKKGKKVKFISWEQAIKLFEVQNEVITVPYGNTNSNRATRWGKELYKTYASDTYTLSAMDSDDDFCTKEGLIFQAAMLKYLTINFKPLLH